MKSRVPAVKDYRSYSLWLDEVDEDLTPRASLDGDAELDVAVVGGGYTGLWTAYYLKKADPGLRVAILEKEICGFGASGRNGGWCSAFFAGSRERTLKRHGRDAAIAMQQAMFESVDEVGRVAAAEEIEIDYLKGGMLAAATSSSHLSRLRREVDYERSWGFGEDDFQWLEEKEARARIDIPGVRGAVFSPHCARIQPAKLARGLARVVEGLGTSVFEQTAATRIEPRRAETSRGTVRADVVVRATEGYTPRLGGMRRVMMPIYSLMVATEPLPAEAWDAIGWAGRETFTDGRHLLIYAQRTADDRIAIGGRGAPYHFGSRISDDYERVPRVFADLAAVVRSLFPAAADARVTHRWGGPLGIPRDWYSSVGFDRTSGLAWAGGYVGDGVSTANLAGRTLADLILERTTEITSLPWVNHRSRSWEPEPLRWIGTNFGRWVATSADKVELRTGRPARRTTIIERLTGHH